MNLLQLFLDVLSILIDETCVASLEFEEFPFLPELHGDVVVVLAGKRLLVLLAHLVLGLEVHLLRVHHVRLLRLRLLGLGHATLLGRSLLCSLL